MIGWNEITGDNVRGEGHVQASQSERLAPGTIVQFWDGDISLVNKAIEKGYDVVNSNRFFTYLDYPYEVTPFEKAYSFNPIPDGLADADKEKILGTGCQMWGEFTPNLDRLYYQIFPRIAAYAECGWTPADKKYYEDFRKRLKKIENIWKEKGYLKTQLDKYCFSIRSVVVRSGTRGSDRKKESGKTETISSYRFPGLFWGVPEAALIRVRRFS